MFFRFGVADLLFVGNGGVQQRQGLVVVTLVDKGQPKLPLTVGYPPAIANHLEEGNSLREGGCCVHYIPLESLGACELAQGVAFAAPVTEHTCDGERALTAFDRVLGVAQIGVGFPQAIQDLCFAASIA
jgi:hypothetical protein